jgi:hypothetical protein
LRVWNTIAPELESSAITGSGGWEQTTEEYTSQGKICVFREGFRRDAFSTLIKKKNQIFLIYKEIQNGAVAKSYMRNGFLIYEEMRKYLIISEEAVSHV